MLDFRFNINDLPIAELKNETSTFGKLWTAFVRGCDKEGYKITSAKEVTNNVVLPTDIHALK